MAEGEESIQTKGRSLISNMLVALIAPYNDLTTL